MGAGFATRAVAEPAKGGESFAQIESLTPLQAEEQRIRKSQADKPAAYQDKFLDASQVDALDRADGLLQDGETDGRGPRSYGVETRLGYSSYDDGSGRTRTSNEFGQSIHYTERTLNWGEWGIQAQGRFRNGDDQFSNVARTYFIDRSSQRITLSNLGLPITSSVYANTFLGDQYVDTTDALRRNYRLYLGNSMVRGLGTRVYGSDFDVVAGIGERGRLIGSPYLGFQADSGALSWLGATQRFGNGYYAGAQLSHASGVAQNLYALSTNTFDPSAPLNREAVSSLATSVGYGTNLVRNGDFRWRLMWLHSLTGADIAGRSNRADGVFAEMGVRLADIRHEFGVFDAGPNLRSGDNLIASDNRGAYWRADGSMARLSWSFGTDITQYNPQHEAGRQSSRLIGVYGSAQYRINRHDQLGLSGYWGNQRRYESQGSVLLDGQRTVQTSASYQTRFLQWAPTRFRVNYWQNQAVVADSSPANGQEVQWEQDWITGKFETQRPELLTTLGYARDVNGGVAQRYPTAGIQTRYWVSADWNIGATLRYSSRTSNLFVSRGLSGTLTSETQLEHGWRLGFSMALNQARTQFQNIVGLPTALLSRTDDKSAYVYLRWDGSKGRPIFAAGNADAQSVGGGVVRGVVFMDADNDGEQRNGEAGVANVEVILDGRARTVTDAAGRFEFPMVATGHHRLSMRAESVPLPWGPAERDVSVEVSLRGVADARLPVIRVGSE